MAARILEPGANYAGNEVLRLLGAGGFAEVYEVRDPSGARRALKILDAEAEARPKLRARLAQEGAALAMIEHVNVVRLYDAGMADDRIYLLLELVAGKNLREARSTRGPTVATVTRWIHQAAEGIAEAHRIGVIHRDLKPENILVTDEDIVKVIDFGIAKLKGWGVRTTNEQKLGTALYMSPEHIQGKPPDVRMDVYAMGLILYEALVGKHPIVAAPASVFQICSLQLSHRPTPLHAFAPEIPPDLAAVADRALEKDPDRRFPSMRAFAIALHEAMLRLGEDRRAALRHLASGPGSAPTASSSRPSLATTEPMVATGSPSSRPRSLSHLARTEPLGSSHSSHAFATAPTAPVVSSDITEAPTTPVARRPAPTMPMQAQPPSAPAPAIGSAPRPVVARPRSNGRVVAVVIVVAVLALAAIAWLVLRALVPLSR